MKYGHLVTFHVDQEMNDWLTRKQQSEGGSRSDAVRRMLQAIKDAETELTHLFEAGKTSRVRQ